MFDRCGLSILSFSRTSKDYSSVGEAAMERHDNNKRGFAAMDPEKAREIHRLGGQTAHRLGKAHTFTSEEARQAGKKGGHVLSRDRAHMAEIGRRGGENSRKRGVAARVSHGQAQ
jgi:uncharacterized protein